MNMQIHAYHMNNTRIACLNIHAFVAIWLCAISHFNTMECFDSYSGAMNDLVMADTLPFTTECSYWIAPLSMVSMMDAQCFVKLNKGQKYIC